jgi:hypothetical protein
LDNLECVNLIRVEIILTQSVIFCFDFSATKACFISSTIFLLEHIQLIQFEPELIYLCVASMFIYVRVITVFFKQYDPLMPFENLSSGILFNSWSETIVIMIIIYRLLIN